MHGYEVCMKSSEGGWQTAWHVARCQQRPCMCARAHNKCSDIVNLTERAKSDWSADIVRQLSIIGIIYGRYTRYSPHLQRMIYRSRASAHAHYALLFLVINCNPDRSQISLHTLSLSEMWWETLILPPPLGLRWESALPLECLWSSADKGSIVKSQRSLELKSNIFFISTVRRVQ